MHFVLVLALAPEVSGSREMLGGGGLDTVSSMLPTYLSEVWVQSKQTIILLERLARPVER